MNEQIPLISETYWNSSSTTTFANQVVQIPTREVTFIGAIFAFVFIFFGLIGNILLIATILSVKKLRSNIINIFIVSVSLKKNEN